MATMMSIVNVSYYFDYKMKSKPLNYLPERPLSNPSLEALAKPRPALET